MTKHWSVKLVCSCGAIFRSIGAEAMHHHNFPLLCRATKQTSDKAEHLLPEFCPAELPMRVGGGAKS